MHNADIMIKSLIRQHYWQNNKLLKKTLEIYVASYNLFYHSCILDMLLNAVLKRVFRKVSSNAFQRVGGPRSFGEPSKMIRITGDQMYYTHIFRHSLSKASASRG